MSTYYSCTQCDSNEHTFKTECLHIISNTHSVIIQRESETFTFSHSFAFIFHTVSPLQAVDRFEHMQFIAVSQPGEQAKKKYIYIKMRPHDMYTNDEYGTTRKNCK